MAVRADLTPPAPLSLAGHVDDRAHRAAHGDRQGQGEGGERSVASEVPVARDWLWIPLTLAVGSALGAAGGVAAFRVDRAYHARTDAHPSRVAPPPPPASPAVIAPAIVHEDAGAPGDEVEPATLAEQRARLFASMRRELALTDAQMTIVEAIFDASSVLGQGNPAISQHPMTPAECREIRASAGLPSTAHRDPACRAPNMAPLYDPGRLETAKDARVCVDQYEFPNIPCEYPVVNVQAREAALLCRAVGKRICDAGEWEGACAGALHRPEEDYDLGRPRREASAHHNAIREKVWSYGPVKNHLLCATGSTRTPNCPGGGWDKCGSNTYPAGAFPMCQSRFGVFDLNGNVAEHTSLPVVADDLAKNGDKGWTEMKGSWFVFASIEAHEDDCRWRAPAWHETRLQSEGSHWNYHLGFRCCDDVDAAEAMDRPQASR